MQSNVSASPLRLFVSEFAMVIVSWLAMQVACATSPVADGTAPRSGVPNKRVVVRFADLARQQAEQADTNRVMRSIHAPMPRSRPWTNTLSGPIRKAGPPPSGPAPQPAASSSAPPELGGSFPAIIDDQRFIPPDTMGAVGPAHVMTTLNSEVAVQTRQGAVLSKVKLDAFWNMLGHAEAFDPKLLYDHFHQRWLFVSLADGESTASALMIGVSKTSDPTGDWTLFDVDADAGNTQWADYPNVGFNEQRVIVTVNMFTVAGSAFVRSAIFSFSQQDLTATGSFKTFFDPGFTFVPAVNYDPGQNTSYLLTQEDDGKSLRIASVSGPVGQETITTNVALAVSPEGWQFEAPNGNFLPQLGTSIVIEGNDSRLMNCVLRNGSLWCTHHIFLPAVGTVNRAAVQWWQIQPSGAVIQRGRIEDPGARVHYAFPSIAVNVNSDVLIGYSRFSPDQFASANYTYHFSSDLAGATGDDVELKAGEAPYTKDFGSGRVRWGDYSATVVDPLNDIDMWTIQEYAATPDSRGDRWGTWWGQLIFGGAPDGILEVNVNPPSDSVLLAGSTENIFVRVTDGLSVTNAIIAAKSSDGSALDFRNDGMAPDQTAGDAVYSDLFNVPTNAASVTITLVISAPGKETATNTITYSIVPPPLNDNFTNATKVPSGGADYITNNRFATREAGEPAHAGIPSSGASLWWSWTPVVATNVLIDTTGSGFDTVVAVYTGNALTNLTPVIAVNDVGSRKQAYVNLPASLGVTYKIAVAAVNTNNVGKLLLNIAPGGQADTNVPVVSITSPPSGLFTATSRISLKGTVIDPDPSPSGISQVFVRVNTRTLSDEGGGSDHGEGDFIWTALDLSPGETPISTNWFRDVALKEGDNTIQVTASDVAGNRSAPVSITVIYRLIDPTNDLFANPIELTGVSGTSSVNNARATKESGEPLHAGNAGGKSVWWSFQAPADGILFLTTSNSTFDTVMGLYQGTRVSNLATIASNDDAFENSSFSKISQAVRANEDYRIAVDGFGGSSGQVLLNYIFTTNSVHLLTVNGTAGGTVAPGSGFYADGSTVLFSATPDPNYEFVDWEGGLSSSANPLAVLVNADIAFTARFRAHAFTDGFESGGLTALPWSQGGWQVQTNVVSSGKYAALSGAITNSQTNNLSLTYSTPEGVGSFDYKVSSETNWDRLEFYLNGVLLQSWSGEVGWATYQFAVPAGTNLFEWRYVKDPSGSVGLDAAFIDNLDLPQVATSLRLFNPTVGGFQVQFQGAAPQSVRIQGSTNLASWQDISTMVMSNGDVIQFTDPQTPYPSYRFYRAVSP